MVATVEKRVIYVLTVDDHPMIREGIASVINREPDMQMVGEAENGAEGLDQFRRLKPDVTLMDIQMPGLDGIDAIAAIMSECPTARIVALTTYEGDVQAQRALKAGAAGFLLKSVLGDKLVETIRTIDAGGCHIPAQIAQEIALHTADERLTSRELEVLHFVALGNSNKQIARALAISEDTVKAHLKRIFVKLKVEGRTEAVTLAARRGIIQL